MWITFALPWVTMESIDVSKKWNKVLEIIKDEVSIPNYRTWFSKTHLISYENNFLEIGVPSKFIQEQLVKKYLDVIKKSVAVVFPENPEVSFKVSLKEVSEESKEEEFIEFDLSSPQNKPQPQGLNPKYNLENFVVGLSNNLAYAAAQAVIANPGISYNPLFIYGGTGVGKTHLMHGVGQALLKKNPYLKIIYCSSEKFMNDFIESLQTKKMGEFRSRYRSCDLLLIDDIQFISGRDSTQEEFFHTFNDLQSKNSQVILTSDRPPHEIQKLESRLASRFQGGLMVDIQQPDFDTRVAILRARCHERGDVLPEECLTLIAQEMPTNARELEGKLLQIIQSLKLMGKELSLENVKAHLGKPVSTTDGKIDYKKVLNQVNQYFNLKMVDLTGPRRKKELVLPRQLAMFLLYQECHLPYEKIGEMLGGRDHTTIMHGVEKIQEVSQRDREVQRLLIELKNNLTN